MITKAIILSINAQGTRCKVRMPLFETSANPYPVTAEALVNITPGIFNNLKVGDVVFVAFEENALEKPIILGKLFRGVGIEGEIRGGRGVFDSLKVNSSMSIPASTGFIFPLNRQKAYKDFTTPLKVADYIKWLEQLTKTSVAQLDDNFRCLKNWTQFQLRAENVEIDDGDIDVVPQGTQPLLYQEEGQKCKICSECTKNGTRCYIKPAINKNYPNI